MKTIKNTDSYALYRMEHDETYGGSYFFHNKTEKNLIVKLDMSNSNNCYFCPDGAKTRCTIEAGVMKYLCSCINDPETKSYSMRCVLNVRDEEDNKL